MGFLERLWQRALVSEPALPWRTSATIGVVAFVAVLLGWRWIRLATTICHEAGHATTGLLVGRRVGGIRLHADSSGMTLTRGRPRGAGMVATLLAGYPASSLVGLGVAALVGAGRGAAAVWLLVVLLAIMLLAMRNLYGAAAVLIVGICAGLASWYAVGPASTWLASVIAWLLLLAGPRPVLELASNRDPASDAAQLAALTGVPRLLWVGLWLLVTLAALAVGALLLLPGVPR